MDIKWLQPEIPSNLNYNFNNEILFSILLNSMIVLFAPASRNLFTALIKKLNLDFSKKIDYIYLNKINKIFIKIPGNEYLKKILYLIDSDINILYYYAKMNNETNILGLSNFLINTIIPESYIFSPTIKLIGIEYLFTNIYFKSKIKIQNYFKNFELNSIYVKIQKAYSIVKIKNIWYIYDDRIGFINIPFIVKNNIIIFETIKLNNIIFSFDQVVECVFFYLKITQNVSRNETLENKNQIMQKKKFIKNVSKKIINERENIASLKQLNNIKINQKCSIVKSKSKENSFKKVSFFDDNLKECNCFNDIGWKKVDYFCMSGGMMAMLIPLNLRKIFVNSFSKKYKISLNKLFSDTELFEHLTKKKNFSDNFSKLNIMNKDVNPSSIIKVLFSAIDNNIKNLPIYLMKNELTYYKLIYETVFKEEKAKYFEINEYKKFNLKYNFFVINCNKIKKIKNVLYKDFYLCSIIICVIMKSFNGRDNNHKIALIKCKHGWFLYDNNLTTQNKKIISHEPILADEILIFKPLKYEYGNSVNESIDIDFNKKNINEYFLVYVKK